MNEGRYSVLDIANYIINYSNNKGYKISNLKLQKVLYFIQAAFLKFKHTPCFNEEMEAWDFGPVVPAVYHQFKRYGNRNIPKINSCDEEQCIIMGEELNCFDEIVIDEDDKKTIQDMVDICSGYSASRLVEITHNQMPWKDAYRSGRNSIIPKQQIADFFKKENN